MDKAAALLLASWRAALTYRLRLLFSLGALAASAVPVWYAANAMQRLMSDHIRDQGDQYFAFVLVGMATFSLITIAVGALPGAIASRISNGGLEALLSTPIRQAELVVGLVSYDLTWTILRAVVIVSAGALLGAHIVAANLMAALAILLLIVLAYLPFGLMGAALMLAYRTTGPLPSIVLWISGLLGGVYFPTQVVPELARTVSVAVPLTYGLRALRGVLLEGESIGRVLPDLLVLSGLGAALMVVGVGAYAWALRQVRRMGTLSQY